jgi:hypothetical protein
MESLRNTERVPFGTTQKRRSLSKGLENIKAHLKLSFVRDKYIPLKREYIKSLNGRSNVTYLVKGICICRAMEHGILELHRCRI